MEEWTYNFKPVTKAEWIRQIESDLKGRNTESLHQLWWPGMPLIPYVHEEDVHGEIIRLPDELFSRPPLITEHLKALSHPPEILNASILQSLAYGTESLNLKLKQNDAPDLSTILRDVNTEIIELSFEFDEPAFSDQHLWVKQGDKNALMRVVRDVDNNHGSEHAWVHASPLQPVMVYPFSASGDWIASTVRIMNVLLQDISLLKLQGIEPSTYLSRCIFRIDADPTYFKHIIQNRVLHLLFLNLRTYFDPDHDFTHWKYLESYITPMAGEQADRFLIRASLSGLAASLTGVHRVCIISPESEDHESLYPRVCRNIHHLLSMESGMYHALDPLAGAYAIDLYSREWFMNIWNALETIK